MFKIRVTNVTYEVSNLKVYVVFFNLFQIVVWSFFTLNYFPQTNESNLAEYYSLYTTSSIKRFKILCFKQ